MDMQSTETLNEGLRRGYSITLATNDLDAQVLERLETARPNTQIRGFRRGKVPIAIMRRNFGKAFLEEVRRDAIQEAITKHFEDSGDTPVRTPDVDVNNEEWAEGADVRFSLTYECKPDMPELDFSSIELEKPIVDVGEDLIDEAVQNLAERAVTFEDTEAGTSAETGYQVVVDFSATVDGKPVERTSATDFPLVLGSGSALEGFEEGLVGAAAGDGLDIEVRLPGNFGVAEVAGKDAVFRCNVSAVRKPVIPAVDDKLAEYYGQSDVGALRAAAKANLEEQLGSETRTVLKRRLLDMLDSRLDFELPPSMLEDEAQSIAISAATADDSVGDSDDSVGDAEQKEVAGDENPTPTDAERRLAARRVRLALFLLETAERVGISVSDADLYGMANARGLLQTIPRDRLRKLIGEDSYLRRRLTNEVLEEKTVDYIFELATITEHRVSTDQLNQLIEEQDEDVVEEA